MSQQPSRRVRDWIEGQKVEAAEASRKLRRTRTRTRYSLEDVLHDYSAAYDAIPEEIPLPESRTESVAASDEEDSGPRDRRRREAARHSLELIGREDTFITPASIPLPESRPSSLGKSAARVKPRPKSRPKPKPKLKREPPKLRPVFLERHQSYFRILDRAAGVFDHIKNGKTRKTSRLAKTDITLYRFYHNDRVERVEINDNPSIRHFSDIPKGVKSLLFIVEDLSERTIHALGESFGVTPEFFEEHLLNSGYAGAHYDDLPARSWKTAGLAKSYASIQWFRPIYRQPPIFSNRDKQELLGEDSDGLEYVSGRSTVTLKAETNIFRAEWDLRIDPRGATKDLGEFGLVERASIWKQYDMDSDCEIVIVLVDPLPKISIGYDWTIQIQKDDNHSMDSSDYYDYPDDATGVQRIVVLPDGEASGVLEIPIENMRPEPARPVWNWIRRRRQPALIQRKVHTKTSSQVLIRQMAPRKTITIDLDQALVTGANLDTLEEDLNETRSTRAELIYLIDRQPYASVVDALFELIRHDTLTLLRVLHPVLEEMEVDVLDDTKMEDRLPLWRQLISQAQKELPELKSSTKSFLAFSNINIDANSDQGIKKDVYDLFQEIDGMLSRLQRASSSLTSNMGLLESRRSIDEAHAVTRLTELAFLFIPLSFATSIFGMQIEPFKDNVPISKFFLVAIVVTTFAYLMRLAMRSQWLESVKRSVKLDVRRYAEQHNLPAQVRSMSMLLLVQWFGSSLKGSMRKASSWTADHARSAGMKLWGIIGFPISFILLIGIIALAPVTVLWTRNLDPGVQGTVTAVIMLSIIGLVGVPYWRKSDPEFRDALPNLIRDLRRRIPHWVLYWSLAFLGVAVFVALPLALIWTRPLAAGIKAGLTAAIVVVAMAGIVLFVITRLYYAPLRLNVPSNASGSGYADEMETSSRSTP